MNCVTLSAVLTLATVALPLWSLPAPADDAHHPAQGPSALAQAQAQSAAPLPATSAVLSESTIKALQDALSQQGIAVDADGVLSDATRAAIRRYQSQHHLPVTGEPDKATLDKLGVRQTAAPAQPPALAQATPTTPPAASPSAQAQAPTSPPMQPGHMPGGMMMSCPMMQGMPGMQGMMHGQMMQMMQGMMQMMHAQMQMMHGQMQTMQSQAPGQRDRGIWDRGRCRAGRCTRIMDSRARTDQAPTTWHLFMKSRASERSAP